ncbi:MAG: carbohydrate porin, partial [Yersinia sp. (in: enterobacteria)]
LGKYQYEVYLLLYKWLNRRSQRRSMTQKSYSERWKTWDIPTALIEYFNSANAGLVTSGLLTSPDKYDVHTIHTSYKIANIMDMNNFNLYLGAYWSKLEVSPDNKVVNAENDDRYGVRARFKYFF